MKNWLRMLLLLAFTGMLSSCATGPSITSKVLIIGIDGCRPDALQKADTPNLDSLWKNGAYHFAAKTDPITSSGPCWTAMLTGVWHEKHGVVSNRYKEPDIEQFPHFFRRIKERKPELNTVSLVNWAPMHTVLKPQDADLMESHKPDENLAQVAAGILNSQNPDVIFVAFDDLDHAGHEFGFDPENNDYLAAIEKADELVGVVLNGLKSRKTYVNEQWLILVSTDHGGIGTSHGGNSPEESTVFFIASGPAVKAGRLEGPVGIVDIPATALVYLGIEIESEWDFDGKPIGLK